jgi:hypothetical protein
MGQYFYIINTDKKEYIDPDNMNSGLKLWEICNNIGANSLLIYLLRESEDESSAGGGIGKNAGRWARDRIVVVGDYAKSGLFHIAKETYKEISNSIKKEFQHFMR